MEIPKPSDADRDRFLALVPEAPGVEAKPMFGNLGGFVNGNMFMGLFGSDIGVKLGDADRERLLAVPGTGPFGPAERPMSGYVTLPGGWTPDEAEEWVAAALANAAALPPKLPKPKAAKAKAAKKAAKPGR
jgi:TfoX/Sxy family transcriptional regulator of competence genes